MTDSKTKPKILVVDDDTILLVVLKSYLEKNEYDVRTANSAEKGLGVFETYQPDLVVSDVAMPGMDGLAFCETMRTLPSGQLTPFLFLSGKDDLSDRVKGHASGADDYITKPFEMKELLAKIEGQWERLQRMNAEIQNLLQRSLHHSDRPGPTTPKAQPPAMAPLPLTAGEQRVFWEVVQGLTNKQISDRLFISPRTVQTHLSNILKKLHLENRAQLVRFAYENGYQTP